MFNSKVSRFKNAQLCTNKADVSYINQELEISLSRERQEKKDEVLDFILSHNYGNSAIENSKVKYTPGQTSLILN